MWIFRVVMLIFLFLYCEDVVCLEILFLRRLSMVFIIIYLFMLCEGLLDCNMLLRIVLFVFLLLELGKIEIVVFVGLFFYFRRG